jgi:hypothetical protein
MDLFGKRLSEYLQFQKALLLATLVVGTLRFGLSIAGFSHNIVKWLSLDAMAVFSACVYAVRIHIQDFGSYRNHLVMVVIQNLLIQAIIIAAIVLGILTGQDSIFTAPEFTIDPITGRPGTDGRTWTHAVEHAIFGFVVISTFLWGLGALVLLAARKIAPRECAAESGSRAAPPRS